jgi:hypothetical protein
MNAASFSAPGRSRLSLWSTDTLLSIGSRGSVLSIGRLTSDPDDRVPRPHGATLSRRSLGIAGAVHAIDEPDLSCGRGPS